MYRFWQRFVLDEPTRLFSYLYRNTTSIIGLLYFSFNAPPTPVPFPCTDTDASMKPQDEVAAVTKHAIVRRLRTRSIMVECMLIDCGKVDGEVASFWRFSSCSYGIRGTECRLATTSGASGLSFTSSS